METITIKDEFIKLGQALKETQRGKKLHPGDTFTYEGKTVTVLEKK